MTLTVYKNKGCGPDMVQMGNIFTPVDAGDVAVFIHGKKLLKREEVKREFFDFTGEEFTDVAIVETYEVEDPDPRKNKKSLGPWQNRSRC